jgi:hypothetical protein
MKNAVTAIILHTQRNTLGIGPGEFLAFDR